MIEYLAFLLSLIASSSDIGFRFVQTLVQIYHGIEGFVNTILGLDYQVFWVIVMFLVAIFFGWLLYRIGSKIGQVADALVARNKAEMEWRDFANEFDQETEDQVEDALDEKLK